MEDDLITSEDVLKSIPELDSTTLPDFESDAVGEVPQEIQGSSEENDAFFVDNAKAFSEQIQEEGQEAIEDNVEEQQDDYESVEEMEDGDQEDRSSYNSFKQDIQTVMNLPFMNSNAYLHGAGILVQNSRVGRHFRSTKATNARPGKISMASSLQIQDSSRMHGFQSAEEQLEDKVKIDDQNLVNLENCLNDSPYMGTAIQHLISFVMGSGITIIFNGISETIDLSTLSTKFCSQELTPFFKQWMFYQIAWGFCVYDKVPSKHLKGLYAPVIVRKSKWQSEIGYEKNVQKFLIHENLKRTGTESKASAFTSHSSTGRPGGGDLLKGAKVSVLYPPMESGKLTAPYAVLKKKVDTLEKMWDDVKTATDKNANVEYVVETPAGPRGTGGNILGLGGSGSKNFDPATASNYQDGDVTQAFLEASEIEDENERFRYLLASSICALARTGDIVIPTDGEKARIQNDNSKRQQDRARSWENPIILPKGQKVTAPPEAKLSPQTPEYMRMLMSLICSRMGVLDQTLNSGGSSSAANAEVNLRSLNSSIKQMQQLLVPKMEEIFEEIWKETLDELREDAARGVAEQIFSFNTKEGISNSNGKVLEKQKGNKMPQFAGESKSQSLTPYKGKEKQGKGEALQVIKFLLEEGLKEQLSIKIKFNQTPLTSTDNLIAMRDLGVISHETFCKHMLSIHGLPQTDLAPEKDRQEFVEHEKKMKEAELKAAQNAAIKPTMAGPSKPGQPNSAAKPAKKPGEKSGEKSSSESQTGKKRKRDSVNVSGTSNEERKNKKRKTAEADEDGLKSSEKQRKAVSNRVEK